MPEHKIYERAMQRAIGNLGGAAHLVMAGDRGLSVESVFKFNTDRGIASVLPYRRHNGSEPAHPARTSDYDENGIPRCRHCGGSTSFVSFRVDKGRGRVWFKCDLPVTPGCDKVQTLNCSKSYRRVLPPWRNEEAYAAMRPPTRCMSTSTTTCALSSWSTPTLSRLATSGSGAGCTSCGQRPRC